MAKFRSNVIADRISRFEREIQWEIQKAYFPDGECANELGVLHHKAMTAMHELRELEHEIRQNAKK